MWGERKHGIVVVVGLQFFLLPRSIVEVITFHHSESALLGKEELSVRAQLPIRFAMIVLALR